MGRKLVGATVRSKLVAIRVNEAEQQELDEKKARRGIADTSHYFRTLMHEDGSR